MTKERQDTSAETAMNEQQNTVSHNLRFYSQGCEVPADAIKAIQAGRLRGMSDVNPMWRMKKMTEIFGPVGFGWKYTIDRQWVEEYVTETTESKTAYQPQVLPETDGQGRVIKPGIAEKPETTTRTRIYEVKCFCNVSLYVRDPETKEWSAPIPGNGGSSIVSKERGGAYVNDEGYKMALTDALSIAMKPLGIGANIWYGPKATGHNESKYESATRDQDYSPTPSAPQQRANPNYTGEQLNAALRELADCATEQQFAQIWKKWSESVPALCYNGTPFYNDACRKIESIRNSKAAK